MKSMRISAKENIIEVEFKTSEKATKVYEGLYDFEQKECFVNHTKLVYDLRDTKFSNVILVVKNLFCKSFDDGSIFTNLVEVDGKITEYTTVLTNENKLFEITLVNERDTIGKYGFGCWQYGRILNFDDSVPGTFQITIRNSNMDEAIPKLVYEKDIDIIIKIGELQF